VPNMSRKLTKRDAERLLAAVEAAGDDPAQVREALMPYVPIAHLERLDLDALFDLAAELNETRSSSRGAG